MCGSCQEYFQFNSFLFFHFQFPSVFYCNFLGPLEKFLVITDSGEREIGDLAVKRQRPDIKISFSLSLATAEIFTG